MSGFSDDIELFRLERAAEFMRGVRLTQSGIDKLLVGHNSLSPEKEQAITQAVENSALVAAVKESAEVDLQVNHLAERFEEMCRRQGVHVDAELRPSVVKLLAAELWVNHRALDMPAEKLISATLHQGAIAPELLQEFPEFRGYVINCAVTGTPASSRAFLERTKKGIEAVAAEPEFERFAKERPSAFIAAAVDARCDMRSALRKLGSKTGHWTAMEERRQKIHETNEPSQGTPGTH